MTDLFDLDQLAATTPFEIESQAAHPLKHAGVGIDDIQDVWRSDPLLMSLPSTSPTDTWRTDDQEDDSNRRT